MYQIDHTKSTVQNVAGMINDIAQYPIQTQDFKIGALKAITPSEANGQSDTELALLAGDSGMVLGDTFIQYKRLTIPTSRPNVGNKVYSTGLDSHEDIHAKIFDRLRLVGEEVVVTNPRRLPLGGEIQEYTLNPKPGSLLYAPGAYVIHVKNRDPYVAQTPDVFFGAPIALRNGRKVYHLPSQPTATYMSAQGTEKQAFLKLLDLFADIESFKFTEDNILFGAPVSGTQNGFSGNTFVDFEPGENSPLSEGGTFLYSRLNMSRWYNSVPQEIVDSDPADTMRLLLQWLGVPGENVVPATGGSFGPRTVWYSVNDQPGTLVVLPTPVTYLILIP